ncbi:MAG: ABC transporter substrate-binding protein [Actinobacteria bacterium]|nr:ABC transporter substrate-binding protein [Actinomycetota bacterium]
MLHVRQQRLVLGLILLLVFGVLALTGCGGGATTTTAATAPAETTSTAPGEATTTSQAAATGEPIKIGLIADNTGSLAHYGHSHEVVAKAAVAKINAEGGIAGRPVELLVEDTESQPTTAAVKARKLVESNRVDFLLGTNHAGVAMAVAPVAKELKTIYFATSSGVGLRLPGNGSRFVFQLPSDTKQETRAAAQYAVNTLNLKNWVTAVADYAWGWDSETAFEEQIQEAGGTLLKKIRVPVGTSDWLKYLQGIPDETEGVFFANFGPDFLSFVRDVRVVNPKLTLFGQNYVLTGIDVSKLGADAEGMYVVTAFPQVEDQNTTEFQKQYRSAIGVDANGVETATGKMLAMSFAWATWESLYTIKEVIEDSGWASKADYAKFIEALEGRTLKEGLSHPEGTKQVRAEDHGSIKGMFIEQIKDGKVNVVTRFEPDALTWPPLKNMPQEEPLS